MQRRLFLKITLSLLLAIFLSIHVFCNQDNALENAISQAKELTQQLSAKKVFETLSFGISECFKNLSASLGIGIAVLLLSGIFSCFSDSFSSYSSIFECISSLSLVICSLSIIDSCFDTVERCIEALCAYMTSFIPIGTALLYASGNSVTASSGTLINSFFISTVQILSASLIIPSIKAICCITAVNVFCKKTNLSGIVSFFKSSCLWIIGLSFTAFSAILSMQSILTSGADNLAIKGLKFSAARLIPIAGGMVSESLKTVIASMNYIKSVTGIGAVVYIIYTILIPISAIIASKLCMFLLSAVSKAAGIEKKAVLFDGMQGALNILLALLLGCCISFIICIVLFIKITVTL